MTSGIKLHNLSKIYETKDVYTYALQDINLTINPGDYLSISGPSGCGKSTLLSIIGLLDTPSRGELYIDGVPTSSISADSAAEIRAEKIGFVFQSFNLIDDISVFDNIALPLGYGKKRYSRSEIAEKVSAVLKRVGMEHRQNHKPDQLSGGQQQRIAIARALVSSPSLLLVDEPTGNLDSKTGDEIMDIFTELNKNGTSILLVTHEPHYAAMANIQLNLLDGKLNLSGGLN
jgi:putative ABC transport system ATP-binding protein